MQFNTYAPALGLALLTGCASTAHHDTASHKPVSDAVIAQQNATLAKNTQGKGVGPQSPRDLESPTGRNNVHFAVAPASTEMNLCNIHFHQHAEHRGGEFKKHAGNGDGKGYGTGYRYSGPLTANELAPVSGGAVCSGKHGGLVPGDTIELHYVYSSAAVKPAPTLGACLSETEKEPKLRVEAQVFVLVNDKNAADFGELTRIGSKNGKHQALNIPSHTGKPVQYAGSTTGPAFNEQASPLKVSWSVRPKVIKTNIETVGKWCKGNVFNEDHAHGARNLVTNPDLLSKME